MKKPQVTTTLRASKKGRGGVYSISLPPGATLIVSREGCSAPSAVVGDPIDHRDRASIRVTFCDSDRYGNGHEFEAWHAEKYHRPENPHTTVGKKFAALAFEARRLDTRRPPRTDR